MQAVRTVLEDGLGSRDLQARWQVAYKEGRPTHHGLHLERVQLAELLDQQQRGGPPACPTDQHHNGGLLGMRVHLRFVGAWRRCWRVMPRRKRKAQRQSSSGQGVVCTRCGSEAGGSREGRTEVAAARRLDARGRSSLQRLLLLLCVCVWRGRVQRRATPTAPPRVDTCDATQRASGMARAWTAMRPGSRPNRAVASWR